MLVRRLVSLFGVMVCVFLGLYLVWASALWNTGASQGFSSVVPDDPDLVLDQVMMAFLAAEDQQEKPSPEQLQRAAELAPLAGEPLFLAAQDHIRQGELQIAVALLEEARRRNPRSKPTRAALIDLYLQTGNISAAVEEMDTLARLFSPVRSQLVAVLAGLVNDPATHSAALEALPSSGLQTAVLQKIAADGASAGYILDIAHGNERLDKDRLGAVIERSIERGDLAGALQLWEHFFGHALAKPGVFDPEFTGFAGPPFGWRILSNKGGIAEMTAQGLHVLHYGRSRVQFARQLIMLPPGSYQLGFASTKSTARDGPNLAWHVQCANARKPLFVLPFVQNTSLSFVEHTDRFAIPDSGCPAQWLTLNGLPAGEPRARAVIVREVTIEPAPGP